MDEGDQLKEVNLAEDVFEDESKVGLGLDWPDKRTENARNQVVLNLVSRNYVILFGGLMFSIIDKVVKSPKSVEEHQVWVLRLRRLDERVIKK